MHLSPATPGAGAQDAAVQLPQVAGRIDAQPSDLSIAIDAWGSNLRARGKKRRSIEAFRQIVEAGAAACGWSACAHLTHEAVTGWMDSKVRDRSWKGTTYNRNLSAFRSLTRFLRKSKRLAEDPLMDADRAEDDGSDGARAATLEEARAMIRHAWIRGEADRRCKGDRALVWLACFSQACRAGEPEQWVWSRHVFLDGEAPHIRWTKDINKNGKDQDVPLTPELAALLRRHRDRMKVMAKTAPVVARERTIRKVDPDDPEAFVFPIIPPRTTFRADRDAVGIPAKDGRGRGFSGQSARKFVATCLTGRGVPEKMVDRLMRHAGGVEGRYYDPTMAEMAAAMAKLPQLWPETGCAQLVDNSGAGKADLTNGLQSVDSGRATSTETNPRETRSANPPSPGAQPLVWQLAEVPPWLVGLFDHPPAPPGVAFSGPHLPVGSGHFVAPVSGNADYRTHNRGSNQAVADLLIAIARVLQIGAPDARSSRPDRPA